MGSESLALLEEAKLKNSKWLCVNQTIREQNSEEFAKVTQLWIRFRTAIAILDIVSKGVKNKNPSSCFLHGLTGVREEANGVQILI